MTSSADLLQRLKRHVQSEAQTQYEALNRQWSHPLADRTANGWAIEGLTVERIDKNFVTLHCMVNDSRFREGDLLLLHHNNPKDPNALHVELQYDGEIELEVSIIYGNPIFLQAEPQGWVIDQDWFDSSRYFLDALDTAADSLRGREIIIPLLQGKLIPQLDFARYEHAVERLLETNLNETQIEAAAQAYASDLLYLIQGPPGTGKTWMLAHLVQLLVTDGLRVLVTALTHRAIHNALNKITNLDPNIYVCKIGSIRHNGDLNVPNYENFTDSEFGDIEEGYVIGATPFATQSNRLANVEFDVVIFDEASQVTLPLAIMGMLAANKYIFIGDENQLPPVTAFSIAETTRSSVFAYLAGHGNETMLTITYRLNQQLAGWPSKTFYSDNLIPSEASAMRRLILSGSETRWDFVLNPSSPAVFLDLCHRNTTVRSQREAEIVVELVIALLAHGIAPNEIGVIVPYRAQSRVIRSLLRRVVADDNIVPHIVIDTVERMQGQEREVILVSFATASPGFASQMSDFLFQPQRLNVAVTRPRTKLILVGSHHMLDGENYDSRHSTNFSIMRSLLESCELIVLPDGSLI